MKRWKAHQNVEKGNLLVGFFFPLLKKLRFLVANKRSHSGKIKQKRPLLKEISWPGNTDYSLPFLEQCPGLANKKTITSVAVKHQKDFSTTAGNQQL